MKNTLYAMLMENAGSLSLEDIVLRILVAALFGIVIYLSYWVSHCGSIYSSKFNTTLLVLTIQTATVMTVIGNNIALSLGMVGALSIVRFRTSIKDSRDTIYIFWTIIVGICCGVGDFMVAGVGCAVIFLILLLLDRVRTDNRLLLVIRASRNKESEIRRELYSYFQKAPEMKAQNTTETTVEFIFELSKKMLKKAEGKQNQMEDGPILSLYDRLYALGDIHYVNLVAQSDEIA